MCRPQIHKTQLIHFRALASNARVVLLTFRDHSTLVKYGRVEKQEWWTYRDCSIWTDAVQSETHWFLNIPERLRKRSVNGSNRRDVSCAFSMTKATIVKILPDLYRSIDLLHS